MNAYDSTIARGAEVDATTDAPRRFAVVVGATGLVGTELCRQLQRDGRFAPVLVLSRSRPAVSGEPLQIETIDFGLLDEWTPSFTIDTVFCALGTTMRKAGSRTAFRAVDNDLVLAVARFAQRGQARHFIMVSSVGADPASRNFYLRVKGETEQAIAALGLPHVAALRPSLLSGERAERRPAERVMQAIAAIAGPLLPGPLARYRPVPAARVAEVMRALADPGRTGFEVIESTAIANALSLSAPVSPD